MMELFFQPHLMCMLSVCLIFFLSSLFFFFSTLSHKELTNPDLLVWTARSSWFKERRTQVIKFLSPCCYQQEEFPEANSP